MACICLFEPMFHDATLTAISPQLLPDDASDALIGENTRERAENQMRGGVFPGKLDLAGDSLRRPNASLFPEQPDERNECVSPPILTAATQLELDAIYAPDRRIEPTYRLGAVVQLELRGVTGIRAKGRPHVIHDHRVDGDLLGASIQNLGTRNEGFPAVLDGVSMLSGRVATLRAVAPMVIAKSETVESDSVGCLEGPADSLSQELLGGLVTVAQEP